MKRRIQLLLAAGLFYAAPAYAEKLSEPSHCSGAASVGIQDGDLDPLLGFDVSGGQLVTKGALTGTCGHFTLKGQISQALADSTHHGNPADQYLLEGTYRDSAAMPVIGKVDFKVSVAYIAFNGQGGLSSSSDDTFRFASDIARPMHFGALTLAPFIGVVEDTPAGHNNRLFRYLFGGRVDYTGLPRSITLHGEVEWVRDVNSTGAVPYQKFWWMDMRASKQLTSHWTGTVGIDLTQYAQPSQYRSMRIMRDSKFILSDSFGRKKQDNVITSPRITFTYAF
jgi:hypothetical protein